VTPAIRLKRTADSEALSVRRVENIEDMVAQCDVVTIVSQSSIPDFAANGSQNCPLHEQTLGLFNKELLSKMKKGAYLVNTGRGAICVAEDVREALESGQLSGYAGDVWSELLPGQISSKAHHGRHSACP
jgi:formate dehydrogenase